MAGAMPEDVKFINATINAFLTFDSPPKLDDIISDVKALFQYPKLSSVPKGKHRSTKWNFESVGDIDPKRMVRVLNISCDTKEEWVEIVQQQKETSVRKEDLPWWEFVLMTNSGKGEHLLLFRIDHSIADGLSLARVFENILKKETNGTKETEGSSWIPTSMIANKIRNERNILKTILKLPKAIFDVVMAVYGRRDDPTCFSKHVVDNNVVDENNPKLLVFDPVPLDFVKKIKDKAGTDLSSVLLAAWSHAVHEYCHLQDCPLAKRKSENLRFRALLTFGFPHKHNSNPMDILENRWAPLSLNLPVGLKSVSEKLDCVSQTIKNLKSSPTAIVQMILMDYIIAILPRWMSRDSVYKAYSRHSLSFTSVPGPKEKVIIGGKVAKSLHFYVNTIHPVLSILSYDGNMNITLLVHNNAISDPHLLPSCFMKALVSLANEFKIDIPNSVLQSSK